MKETKIVTAYHEKWPNIPEKPDAFIAWWQDKINLVPIEHRYSASIEIEPLSQYGETTLDVTVSYQREETDEEEKERERDEQIRAKKERDRELAILESLKKKYEGG